METRIVPGLVGQTVVAIDLDWRQSIVVLKTVQGDKFRLSGVDASISDVKLVKSIVGGEVLKAEVFVGDVRDRLEIPGPSVTLTDANRYLRYVEHRFTTANASLTVCWSSIGDGTERDLPVVYWTIPRLGFGIL
jgi:hypothetical protein